MNELINIDYEHIKQLRLQRKYAEANVLIHAFQNSFKKNMDEGRKINHYIYQKEQNMKQKNKRCELKCIQTKKILNQEKK